MTCTCYRLGDSMGLKKVGHSYLASVLSDKEITVDTHVPLFPAVRKSKKL